MTAAAPRGETILLTGPPLAGKTSTAVWWAERRARRTSPLDWDQLQKTLFGPRLNQDPDQISNQYRFAAKIAAATAEMITETGDDCVIAGARVPASADDPPEWVGVWDDLDQLDPITVVLLPSLETRLARRRADPGRLPGGLFPYSEEQVRRSHGWAWNAWSAHPRASVLDTSAMNPDEVVQAVESIVAKLSC
ncbi:hypothetical protein FOE78_18835 [Microlunatus elymi]|uniref:AAA domain-containing protein n=1 Tax=Microlunatus elymi TaxID=2596828 RepID=A0A516Q2N3_9ACTN|nr:hypothetical protein [Microlunatus elymi]QDP97690.1 hypothetical protein FOE78_18835 [Microlunatus elymi]